MHDVYVHVFVGSVLCVEKNIFAAALLKRFQSSQSNRRTLKHILGIMKAYLGTFFGILILIVSIHADPKCVSTEESHLNDCKAALRRWNELKNMFNVKCCAKRGDGNCEICGRSSAQKATITMMMELDNWMKIIQFDFAPAVVADDRTSLGATRSLFGQFATKPQTIRKD